MGSKSSGRVERGNRPYNTSSGCCGGHRRRCIGTKWRLAPHLTTQPGHASQLPPSGAPYGGADAKGRSCRTSSLSIHSFPGPSPVGHIFWSTSLAVSLCSFFPALVQPCATPKSTGGHYHSRVPRPTLTTSVRGEVVSSWVGWWGSSPPCRALNLSLAPSPFRVLLPIEERGGGRPGGEEGGNEVGGDVFALPHTSSSSSSSPVFHFDLVFAGQASGSAGADSGLPLPRGDPRTGVRGKRVGATW